MDDRYTPLERRPIASREHRVSRAVAKTLAGIGVEANWISIAGMLGGIAAGGAFALTPTAYGPQRLWWIAGALLIQIRLLGNMFDGMVAIERGTASARGELYNEVPDRVSDSAIFIGLGYAADSAAALGYLAACASLFAAYVRAVGKAAGAHQEFCGPFAKPQRMFLVTLAVLWCGLTPASWHSFGDGVPGVPAAALATIVAGSTLTALRRLYRISAALENRA